MWASMACVGATSKCVDSVRGRRRRAALGRAGGKSAANLEDVTAELLAQPLDQFTAERNARAKELKAAGQTDLAKEVAGLKKPPVHLWAANQVAKEEPARLRKLLESSRAVAKAQTGGKAARDLRTASEEFQNDLEAAATAAATVLQRDKHAASEETLRRIRDIFRLAAMQEGAVWDRLEKGALINEPEAGEDVLSMFQAGKPAPREKVSKADERAEQRRAEEAAERAAREDAERAEQLEATAQRLRREAKEAVAAAERADQRARAAEEQAADARAQAKKSQRA